MNPAALVVIICAILIGCQAPTPTPPSVPTPHQAAQKGLSEYRLGAGDLIRVDVFEEPDLSIASVRLSDAGSISFPVAGEIRAEGLTAGELEGAIAEILRQDILINPRINVRVIEYRQFFLNGEVSEPGGYPFQPGLTLRKAIALAGGLTDRATQRMFVISEGRPTEQQAVSLDYRVRPGDIITVQQGLF